MPDHTPGPWRVIEVCVEHMDTQVARDAFAAIKDQNAALLAFALSFHDWFENGPFGETLEEAVNRLDEEAHAAIAKAKEDG